MIFTLLSFLWICTCNLSSIQRLISTMAISLVSSVSFKYAAYFLSPLVSSYQTLYDVIAIVFVFHRDDNKQEVSFTERFVSSSRRDEIHFHVWGTDKRNNVYTSIITTTDEILLKTLGPRQIFVTINGTREVRG